MTGKEAADALANFWDQMPKEASAHVFYGGSHSKSCIFMSLHSSLFPRGLPACLSVS
jgi:hypothetical protein